MTWNLKRTTQCRHCPWRVDTIPEEDIPGGYSSARHAALKSTIAAPGDLSSLGAESQRVMACHEEHEAHCVGWIKQQVGPGNNIALRLRMMSCANRTELRTIGPQHQTFEDTLPQGAEDIQGDSGGGT